MKCPKCNANMIKNYRDYILTSNPPQLPWDWYCGGCKASEYGGREMGKSDDQILQETWEAAQ